LQAWIPQIAERGLQMQCWFLSCLMVYWACFPMLVRKVSELDLRQVVVGIVALCLLPATYLLVPDLFYGNFNWYEYHSWGRMRNFTDELVVFLKFHPICYVHVFILGMLLARLRLLLSLQTAENMREKLGLLLELLAPVGYFCLFLVFFIPMASPPAAKLSARILVLLPLQGAILLGLAGVEGYPQPRLAAYMSKLNFLESYSYCVYVMQFICMTLWSGPEFSFPFFMYLIAVAIFVQVLVQRPAEMLWKVSPLKAAVIAPLGSCSLLLLIAILAVVAGDGRDSSHEESLPTRLVRDGLIDVVFPLKISDEDMRATGGGAIINPSITLMPSGDRWIIAARLHRRSSMLRNVTASEARNAKQDYTAILEEFWHSEILIGSVNPNTFTELFHKSQMPPVQLKRWTGVRTMAWEPWHGENLCQREKYLPENRTLIRMTVTGPEDPKVIPLTWRDPGYCDVTATDCSKPRSARDWCSTSQEHCSICHWRWCGMDEVQIAFSSYTPKVGRGCESRDVTQMFLATGVDVNKPDEASRGFHLKCGQWNHNEKNWIPFQYGGHTYIVYSLVPHLVQELVYDGAGSCGSQWRTVFPPLAEFTEKHAGKAIRGSAQAVYVNAPDVTRSVPAPHFLGLFHVADLKEQRYWHYAYRFAVEPPFQIIQVSKALPLLTLQPHPGSGLPFAFASGLAVHDNQVTITYAAGDREPRALVMSLSRLEQLFHESARFEAD